VRPHRQASPVSRLAALGLFALAAGFVAASVVLGTVGARRDLDLPGGAESRLLLVGLGGAVALLFAAMGLLIARRVPRNAIGWIFLASGTMLAATIASFTYADLAVIGGEGWPAATWVAWFANWSFAPPAFVTPCLVAQLYPDGRPLPGWRWVLWATVAIASLATVSTALAPGPIDSHETVDSPLAAPHALGGLVTAINDDGGVFMAPPGLLLSLAALVVRLRRSRGVERQQMKWLVFAGAVPTCAFTVSFVLGAFADDSLLIDVVFLTGFAALLLIPVAVAVAILRYRLYDIDRVISRTLVYGALTVLLGAAYTGLVLVGQALFSTFTGGSNLAIAVSTLVVAALFLPLRSRLQRLVARRFYRRRYDAERTLATFASRLREQVELERLRADLEAVVLETVQPARVSVWLRHEARP